MIINIDKEAYLHSVRLVKQINDYKLSNNSTNLDAKRIQSTMYGIIIKSVILKHYNQPMPIFDAKNYLTIDDKRYDISKVAYDNLSKLYSVILNKNRFDSEKVDGVVFANIEGSFKQIIFSGCQVMAPIPDNSDVNVYGYADSKTIKNSNVVEMRDKLGRMYDSLYKLYTNNLNAIEGL